MQNDYSFFKKKVRLNTVEKDVFLYKLDKSEIEHKKGKAKKR
jgi:hypothetical protein